MAQLALKKEKCDRHPDQDISGRCTECGTNICRECVQEFGYFCSEICVNASRRSITDTDRVQRQQTIDNFTGKLVVLKYAIRLFLLLLLVGLGLFIWRTFVEAPGELVWELKFVSDGYTGIILGAGDDKMILRTTDGFVSLNTQSGRITKTVNIKPPENEEDRATIRDTVIEVQSFENGYLVIGSKYIYRLNNEGSVVSVAQFDSPPDKFVVNYDKTLIAGMYRTVVDADGYKIQDYFFCLDIENDQELWRKPMKESLQISEFAVLDDQICAFITKTDQDSATTYLLACLSADTGKMVWSKTLDFLPEWGPVAWKNMILYADHQRLRAFDQNGNPWWLDENEKERSIDLPQGHYREIFIKADSLFLKLDGQTTCFDLDRGTGSWKSSVEFGESNITFGKDRIFIMGYTSQQGKTVDVGKMPGFNQAKDVVNDMGLNKMQVNTEVPVLICLDRQTGKLVWKVENAVGDIIAGDDRIVRIMGAHDSMLSHFKQEPETHIFQYDIRNGKLIFSKTHKGFDFNTAKISGDRLVGIIIDAEMEDGKEQETKQSTATVPDPLSFRFDRIQRSHVVVEGRAIAIRLR